MFILRWHFFRFYVFWYMNQGTAQTAEPILTLNTSKEPVWANEVPFFTPKMVKNPVSHAFQWETEMLITFEG